MNKDTKKVRSELKFGVFIVLLRPDSEDGRPKSEVFKLRFPPGRWRGWVIPPIGG